MLVCLQALQTAPVLDMYRGCCWCNRYPQATRKRRPDWCSSPQLTVSAGGSSPSGNLVCRDPTDLGRGRLMTSRLRASNARGSCRGRQMSARGHPASARQAGRGWQLLARSKPAPASPWHAGTCRPQHLPWQVPENKRCSGCRARL